MLLKLNWATISVSLELTGQPCEFMATHLKLLVGKAQTHSRYSCSTLDLKPAVYFMNSEAFITAVLENFTETPIVNFLNN